MEGTDTTTKLHSGIIFKSHWSFVMDNFDINLWVELWNDDKNSLWFTYNLMNEMKNINQDHRQ